MWLTDPKTGEKSVTLTIFIITSIVAIVKLLISGITIGDVSLGTFSASEFGIALGAAGALYWSRKKNENDVKLKLNESDNT